MAEDEDKIVELQVNMSSEQYVQWTEKLRELSVVLDDDEIQLSEKFEAILTINAQIMLMIPEEH